METISINEAIIATMADLPHEVDSTVAITLFRKGQDTVRACFPHADLNQQRPWEEADSFIVGATMNGAEELFD